MANFSVKFPYPNAREVLLNTTLGSQILTNLLIEGGKYKDSNGKEITFEPLNLQACVVGVSNDNNIITTEIIGGKGTVKEYISEADSQIRIYGSFFTNIPNARDWDSIKKLNAIKSAASIKVNCPFLNEQNIYEMVITSITTSEVEGKYNLIRYTIDAISDTPFEVELDD